MSDEPKKPSVPWQEFARALSTGIVFAIFVLIAIAVVMLALFLCFFRLHT